MPDQQPHRIRRLASTDLPAMRRLNALFGTVFEDPANYGSAPPDDAYLTSLLADPAFIVLVSEKDGEVAGGLAAYLLRKFEQKRSEIYIYDLGVLESERRQGIATALIEALKREARRLGDCVIFVQADRDDPPAIALYSKLGSREEVLHFDIPAR